MLEGEEERLAPVTPSRTKILARKRRDLYILHECPKRKYNNKMIDIHYLNSHRMENIDSRLKTDVHMELFWCNYKPFSARAHLHVMVKLILAFKHYYVLRCSNKSLSDAQTVSIKSCKGDYNYGSCKLFFVFYVVFQNA